MSTSESRPEPEATQPVERSGTFRPELLLDMPISFVDSCSINCLFISLCSFLMSLCYVTHFFITFISKYINKYDGIQI